MSIEKKIEDLIASIDANTAALVALAGKPAAVAPKAAKEPKKPVEEPKKEVAPEPTGPTKQQIAKTIEQCLKAGKKAELIAVLKTFNDAGNATAVFAQGPEASQAFIEAAEALLLGE